MLHAVGSAGLREVRVQRTALLSEDGRYRYRLGRRWGRGRPVVWVMLNPSTADADEDDQTVRRCIAFTRAWGHPALEVVNLFALRSPDPAALLRDEDPVGPGNDDELAAVAAHSAVTVVAWGSHAAARARAVQVLPVLGDVWCLGTTADGSPRHPSRVPATSELLPWGLDQPPSLRGRAPYPTPGPSLERSLAELEPLLAAARAGRVPLDELRRALVEAVSEVDRTGVPTG